tara:strand:- start:476 stop:1837 length:1362 start_codon:yes stop_codon:yes gene_type:complete
MKKIILLLLLIPNIVCSKYDDQKTTIIVSAMGNTIDEAKNNALRSAIEQSFGAFVSSNTESLNEEIKEEIVSITNGNIHKYKIISNVVTEQGDYATTLEATVSITQLKTFVKSKGIKVEFKGNTFGVNIKQAKLNKLAEEKAIYNLCLISDKFLSKSLDFSLDVSGPIKSKSKGIYNMLFRINIAPNQNYINFITFFYETIQSISMSKDEIDYYESINDNFFSLKIDRLKSRHLKTKVVNGLYRIDMKSIYLRTPNSIGTLMNFFTQSNRYLLSFEVFADDNLIGPPVHKNKEDVEYMVLNSRSANKWNQKEDFDILTENRHNVLHFNSLESFRGNVGFPPVKFVHPHYYYSIISSSNNFIKNNQYSFPFYYDHNMSPIMKKPNGWINRIIPDFKNANNLSINDLPTKRIEDPYIYLHLESFLYKHFFVKSFSLDEIEKINEFSIEFKNLPNK